VLAGSFDVPFTLDDLFPAAVAQQTVGLHPNLRSTTSSVECSMPNQIKLIAIVLLSTLGITSLAQERSNLAKDGFKIETKSRNRNGVEVINGVPQNVDLANLRRKAESGDPKAQTDLAICLYDGKHGIPVDNVGAYKWATVAASQDIKEAKYLVRDMQIFLSRNDLAEGSAAARIYLAKQKETKR